MSDGSRLELSPSELTDALQYCATPGLPQVLQALGELQQREHAPPYGCFGPSDQPGGWSICVGSGSSDVFSLALDLLV